MVRGRGRRRGRAFVRCGAKIADHIYRGGGTQPKRLKSVEYILLGTLVTNIFPQDNGAFFLIVGNGAQTAALTGSDEACRPF